MGENSFSYRIRKELKIYLGVCPTCGHPGKISTREAAKLIGIKHTALWRFLRGSNCTTKTLDSIISWMNSQAKYHGGKLF